MPEEQTAYASPRISDLEVSGRPLDFCSLSSDELVARVEHARRKLAPSLTERFDLPDGIAWDLRSSPGLRRDLEDLIELERQCCRGLRFTLWEDAEQDRLRLEVRGLDDEARRAGESIFGLGLGLGLDAHLGETSAEKSSKWIPRLGAWLRRGAVAAGISLTLCCLLPIALVSVVGISIAAPIGRLDDPWIIGGMTVVITTLLGVLEKRRAARRLEGRVESDASSSAACGC